MKTLGIIAEYDPFHNGHKYNIERLKEKTGCDRVIVCMSGSYTQRGDIAILPGKLRAETAVKEGADLVLELPLFWSCASAGDFAVGAVSALKASGLVDVLGFGCETDDLRLLEEVSDILTNEPEEVSSYLTDLLKLGYTYPKARQEALSRYTGKDMSFIDSPNVILALEYLKASAELKTGFETAAVKRTGAGHDSSDPVPPYASASYIRECLTEKGQTADELSEFLPESSLDVLERHMNYGRTDSMSPFLISELMRLDNYSHIYDVSADLSNRLNFLRSRFTGFTEFALSVKTKQLTLSRVKRCFMHIINDITDDDMSYLKENGFCRWLGILACGKDETVINDINRHASVPVLFRDSDAGRYLTGKDAELMKKLRRADHRYMYALKKS